MKVFMEHLRSRRILAVVLTLCLVMALMPLSLGNNNSGESPVTTTGDGAVVTPADPDTSTPDTPDASAPADPDTSTPDTPDASTPADPGTSTPDNPDASAPADPGTSTPDNPDASAPADPGTVTPDAPDASAPADPGAGAVTTPPAANVLLTTPDALLLNGQYDPNPQPDPSDLVMTVEFEAAGNPSANQFSMKQAFNTALNLFKIANPGKDWKDVTWLTIAGNAPQLGKDDWEWLKSKCLLTANNYTYAGGLDFASPSDNLRMVDLSGLSNISFIDDRNDNPSPNSVNVTPVHKMKNGVELKVQFLLPENLESVGSYLFYHCNNLVLPMETFPQKMGAESSVHCYISRRAFEGCGDAFPNLTTIPQSTRIDECAFKGCNFPSITDLSFVNNINDSFLAGKNLFEGAGFPNVTELPPITDRVPNGLFMGVDLSHVTTIPDNPDGETIFPVNIFRNANLSSLVTLPKDISSFRDYSFAGANLQSLQKLPDTTDAVDPYAPPDMHYYGIGKHAFDGANLSSLTGLPYPISQVDDYAFANAKLDNFETIDILGNLYVNVFEGVGATSANDNTTTLAKLETINMGSYGVGELSGTFQNVTFPALTKICGNDLDDAAFAGSVFEKPITLLPPRLPEKPPKSLKQKTSISALEDQAFQGATFKSTLTIPNRVNTISGDAFKDANIQGGIEGGLTFNRIEDTPFHGAQIGYIEGGIHAVSYQTINSHGEIHKHPASIGSGFSGAAIGSITGGIHSDEGIGNSAFKGLTLTEFTGDIIAGGTIASGAFENATLPHVGKISADTIAENAFAGATMDIAGGIFAATGIADHAFSSAAPPLSPSNPSPQPNPAKIGSLAGGITAPAIGQSAFENVAFPGGFSGNITATGGDIGASAFAGAQMADFSGDITASGNIASAAFKNAALPHVGKISANGNIENSAFAGAKMDVTGGISANSIEAHAFSGPLSPGTPINPAKIGSLAGGITAPTIGRSAFEGVQMTAFSGGITAAASIGESAFKNAELPGDIGKIDTPSIGQSAFESAKLGRINDGIKTTGPIADSAFQNAAIERLTGGITAPSIGNFAFKGAHIGGGAQPNVIVATSIGDSAFQGATLEGPLNLGEQSGNPEDSVGLIASIGTSAFQGANLPGLTGTLKVHTIGDNAFQDAVLPAPNENPDKNLQLTDQVVSIGANAFKNCANFTTPNVFMGKMTKQYADSNRPKATIHPHAFEGSGVTQWVLSPEDIVYADAFAGANNLQDIYLPWSALPKITTDGSQSDPISNAEQVRTMFPTLNANGGKKLVIHLNMDNPAAFASEHILKGAVGEPSQLNTYKFEDASSIAGKVTGLNPTGDSGIPSYQVWETLHFQVATSYTGDPNHPAEGNLRLSSPKSWSLKDPGGNVIAGGEWKPGDPAVATVYPGARPSGIYTLCVTYNSPSVYTGDPESEYGWRTFPEYVNMFNINVEQKIEFLPPAAPSEASYLLTVQNGTGGGYYQADNAAPIAAKLEATSPQPGAKFLHWELISGTGTFADANSPETSFTMAVGDSTVKAVFELPAKPVIPPAPTPSPPTGDRVPLALPIAAAVLLAGAAGAAIIRRKRKPSGQ